MTKFKHPANKYERLEIARKKQWRKEIRPKAKRKGPEDERGELAAVSKDDQSD